MRRTSARTKRAGPAQYVKLKISRIFPKPGALMAARLRTRINRGTDVSTSVVFSTSSSKGTKKRRRKNESLLKSHRKRKPANKAISNQIIEEVNNETSS